MDKALAHLIGRHGADRVAGSLAGAALHSIRIRSRALVGEPRLGSSRLGGLPDLPDGWYWPRRFGGGAPLSFLGQINLAETAPFDPDGRLPASGVLYLFADHDQPFSLSPEGRDRWQVLYSEQLPNWGATSPPWDLPEEAVFRPSELSFFSQWTLPPEESPLVRSLHLTEAEALAYREAAESGPVHRLLGHPEQIQNYLPHEVAMAESGLFDGCWATPEAETVMAGADQWCLLLQLDSDWDANGMTWGDMGRLYFYIRREDLAQRRFDRVWSMMQC